MFSCWAPRAGPSSLHGSGMWRVTPYWLYDLMMDDWVAACVRRWTRSVLRSEEVQPSGSRRDQSDQGSQTPHFADGAPRSVSRKTQCWVCIRCSWSLLPCTQAWKGFPSEHPTGGFKVGKFCSLQRILFSGGARPHPAGGAMLGVSEGSAGSPANTVHHAPSCSHTAQGTPCCSRWGALWWWRSTSAFSLQSWATSLPISSAATPSRATFSLFD